MPPSEMSSAEDVEKRVPEQKVSSGDTAEGFVSASHNPEYDRYLELHREFEGSGRKRLLKKREPVPSTLKYVNMKC